MNKLSKSILTKIKKAGIKPRPRWQFAVLHILLWSAFVLSLLLGSLAFSVILRTLFQTEWDLVPRIGRGPVHGFFLVLPYIWIATLAIILFLSRFIFSHTKTGYRIRPVYVVLASLLISFFLGAGFHAGHVSDAFEGAMRSGIRPYGRFQEQRGHMWNVPDHGIVAGEVYEITSDTLILLDDMRQKRWKVYTDMDTFFKGPEPEAGLFVIAVGEKMNDDEFRAKEVRSRGLMEGPPFPMPPFSPQNFERN